MQKLKTHLDKIRRGHQGQQEPQQETHRHMGAWGGHGNVCGRGSSSRQEGRHEGWREAAVSKKLAGGMLELGRGNGWQHRRRKEGR
eukprot:6212511-Pleurochrysis_carterae.AAC.1